MIIILIFFSLLEAAIMVFLIKNQVSIDTKFDNLDSEVKSIKDKIKEDEAKEEKRIKEDEEKWENIRNMLDYSPYE